MCFAQKHKIEINENLWNLRNLRSSYFLTPYFLTFFKKEFRCFLHPEMHCLEVWKSDHHHKMQLRHRLFSMK